MKKQINKSVDWLYQHKGIIVSSIAGLLTLAAAFNWKYQDQAKKAKNKMPGIVDKVNQELDSRTNSVGEFKPLVK